MHLRVNKLIKIKQEWIIIGLALALVICLSYIFIYPRIVNRIFQQANSIIINNIVQQLQTQGFVNLVIGNQTIKLVPEVVE